MAADRKISGKSVTNKEGERLFLYECRTLYEWLPAVVERVVERFDPLKVVVFGSVSWRPIPKQC